MPCRRGFIRSLGFSFFFAGRFLRGSDRAAARQTETCEYEPCVNLTLRSRNKVEVSINIVSMELAFFVSFFFYFFFFFLHFYIF